MPEPMFDPDTYTQTKLPPDILNPQPSGGQQYGFTRNPPAQSQTAQPPQPMSDTDIQKMVQGRQAIVDKSIADIDAKDRQRLALASQPTPHPAQPKLGDIPQPPDTKPLNVFKEAQAPLIFATVFGAAMMKNHGMGAMAAATGFLEGWQKGDQERMDRERQKWNDSVDAIIKENGVQKERYDMVLNDTRLSQADKMAKISAISASINDSVVKNSMAVGNYDFGVSAIEKRDAAAQKLYESQLRAGVVPGQEGPGVISDEAMKFMVTQYLTTGDKSVLTNIGRGGQSARNVARFRNMIPEVAQSLGMKPEDVSAKTADFAAYQAATRAAAVRGAQIGVAATELTQFAGPALAASERVPRGQWVPINKLQQNVKRMESDPDLREFSNRNAGLITAYAQVISRTGVPTVRAQNRAEDLLNTAESPEAYQRAVDTLINEADLAEKAPDIVRERLRGKFIGGGGGAATSAPAPPNGPVHVQTPGEAEALAPGTKYVTPDGQTYTR